MIIINVHETCHDNSLFCDGYLTGIPFRSNADWVQHGIDQIEEALNKSKILSYDDLVMLSEPDTDICKEKERTFMIGNDIIEFGRLLDKYDLEHCKVSYIEYDDSSSFSYAQMYLENYMTEVVVSFDWDKDALCFRPVAIRSFPYVYSEVHYPDFDPELKRVLKLKYPKLIEDLYND